MKKPDFRQQVIFGVILIVVANALSIILKNGIYVNLSWILYGIGFILNPVYPARVNDAEKGKNAVRIGGALCILVGLLTKFGV